MKKKLTWTKRCQNWHLLPFLPLTVRHPSFITHSTCSLFKIVVSRIKNKKKWKKLTCGPRDVDIDVSWAPFCHLPFFVHHPGVGIVCCHCFEVVGQMGVDMKSSDGKGVWNYSLSLFQTPFHMTSLHSITAMSPAMPQDPTMTIGSIASGAQAQVCLSFFYNVLHITNYCF